MSWRKYYRILSDSWKCYIFCEYSTSMSEMKKKFLSRNKTLLSNNIKVWNIVQLYENWLLLEDLWETRLDNLFYKVTFEEYLVYCKKAIIEVQKVHNIENIHWVNQCDFNIMFFIQSAKKLSYYNLSSLFIDKTFFREIISDIENRIQTMQYVPSMSDMQSTNIMITWSSIFLLDYQDIRYLPREMDFAAFISDSYINYTTDQIKEILISMPLWYSIKNIIELWFIKLFHAMRLYLDKIDKKDYSYENTLQNSIQRFRNLQKIHDKDFS